MSERRNMSQVRRQQIVISGVGGQGVLFVTKLLAETALDLGLSVLISETHGMAQRGGIVISHLKVAPGRVESLTEVERPGSPEVADPPGASDAPFTSPLIRPGHADILLALHPDGFRAHGYYLGPGGRAFRNDCEPGEKNAVDAVRVAEGLGSPVSANLVLLGFAVASSTLFCRPEELEKTLRRLGGKRLELSLNAFHAGLDLGLKAEN